MVGERRGSIPREDGGRSPDDGRLVRSPVSMVLGAAVVLFVALVVYLLVQSGDPQLDPQQEASPAPEDTTSSSASSVSTPSSVSTVDVAANANASAGARGSAPEPNPSREPYVEASLDERNFVLRGVVPSAVLATGFLRAAEVAYSPHVRSELMVDENLAAADWLVSGPEAIVLLPMITDGTILIADSRIELSGRAPSDADVERLEAALRAITGLDVIVEEMVITNLEPPELVLAADGGRVTLTGRLPTEAIREAFTAAAIAAYGADNVDDQIALDPAVYTSLWMHNGGPLLQAMSVFPDYELRVDGTAFSGFINGGVTFEANSAEFSGSYATVLDVGVGVLTRDQTLQLVIEGHTDSLGPDQVNLDLSQQRADAVMQYFMAKGIAPERLTAVGKGETEPVAPNDTVEGRARNRRIQYILSQA